MDNVMEGQLTENKQEFTEPELESLRRKYKAQDGRIYEVTTPFRKMMKKKRLLLSSLESLERRLMNAM